MGGLESTAPITRSMDPDLDLFPQSVLVPPISLKEIEMRINFIRPIFSASPIATKNLGPWTKFKWTRKQQKLRSLREDLQNHIGDLKMLREQRSELVKFRTSSRGSQIKAPESRGLPLSVIREQRERSGRLYNAMKAIVDYSSHSIDLRIPWDVTVMPGRGCPAGTSTVAVQKNLWILVAPVSDRSIFTCIEVDTYAELGGVVPMPVSACPLVDSSVQTNQLPPKHAVHQRSTATTVSVKRKTVRFAVQEIYKKSRPRSPEISAPGDQPKVLSQSQMQYTMHGIIPSLAEFLKSTHTSPGVLPTIGNFRHVLRRSATPQLETRVYLSDVLANLSATKSIRKCFTWPAKRRYKLAHALSISLLCCSDDWFKDNWRTNDISFLTTHPTHINDESIQIPHISAPSVSSMGLGTGHSTTGTQLVTNERLFSLAIALIEIGYGDSLMNLYLELESESYGGMRMASWDYLKEFYGARKLSGMISEVMGSRYARVVQRCLDCNFESNKKDLGDDRMQEVFYSGVICELERCLRVFTLDEKDVPKIVSGIVS